MKIDLPSKITLLPIGLLGVLILFTINAEPVNHFQLEKEGGYLLLSAKKTNPTEAEISGWQITSGNFSAALPKAAKTFRLGSVNLEEAVVLKPGEKAVIVFGESPIGVSFLTNRCMGHLGYFQNFDPPLPPLDPKEKSRTANFYNDCLFAEKDSADFYLPEWRLYVKETPPTKRLLKLIDSSGKTVETVRY